MSECSARSIIIYKLCRSLKHLIPNHKIPSGRHVIGPNSACNFKHTAGVIKAALFYTKARGAATPTEFGQIWMIQIKNPEDIFKKSTLKVPSKLILLVVFIASIDLIFRAVDSGKNERRLKQGRQIKNKENSL